LQANLQIYLRLALLKKKTKARTGQLASIVHELATTNSQTAATQL
jgi:hypothetical protein